MLCGASLLSLKPQPERERALLSLLAHRQYIFPIITAGAAIAVATLWGQYHA